MIFSVEVLLGLSVVSSLLIAKMVAVFIRFIKRLSTACTPEQNLDGVLHWYYRCFFFALRFKFHVSKIIIHNY